MPSHNVADSVGGSGGKSTLQGGTGSPMPSGTPSCRSRKKSISGSRVRTDRQCQRLRRNGCPGSMRRSFGDVGSSFTQRNARRSARNGSRADSDSGGSLLGETR